MTEQSDAFARVMFWSETFQQQLDDEVRKKRTLNPDLSEQEIKESWILLKLAVLMTTTEEQAEKIRQLESSLEERG